ncbi:protein ZNRD2 [Microcaecilia unicolor]|uniref:Protein ZNRD2 n=1 Tax=Microcaecilia unicolor TaxID=1415580 RepID=A0A6P7ZDR0_9AMPH|nr:protein ZNRD2 [Microcaecilia unicolor]
MEDCEWEPPSEAEMKVIQARRERQDKISKLMGDYLLKGYRMLGECCQICGTILLQDKKRKNYCVACQELDSDIDKDNPALNAQAALSQVRECQLASNSVEVVPVPLPSRQQHTPRPEHCEGAAAGLRGPAPTLAPAPAGVPTGATAAVATVATVAAAAAASSPGTSVSAVERVWRGQPMPQALVAAENAILQKIEWAARELQQTTSIELTVQLCSMIHTCTDSLQGIKELLQ